MSSLRSIMLRELRSIMLRDYLMRYYIAGKQDNIKGRILYIEADQFPEASLQELYGADASKLTIITFSMSEVRDAKKACSQELYGTDSPPACYAVGNVRSFFFTLMAEMHEAGALEAQDVCRLNEANKELRLFSTSLGKFITVPRKIATEWSNQMLGTTRFRSLERAASKAAEQSLAAMLHDGEAKLPACKEKVI